MLNLDYLEWLGMDRDFGSFHVAAAEGRVHCAVSTNKTPSLKTYTKIAEDT